jgi:hypothetical protein
VVDDDRVDELMPHAAAAETFTGEFAHP